jgi:hypothetical protein
MRPGFLRVEVLTDPTLQIPDHEDLRMIPVDRSFLRQNDSGGDGTTYYGGHHIDPAPCCHTNHVGHQGKLAPQFPNASDLVLWETAAKAMSVRKMPQSSASSSSSSSTLDWVLLLPLPSSSVKIPHFWAGHAANQKVQRPSPAHPKLIAQSAGWMASRQEILDLNHMCHGGFLPPFQGNDNGNGNHNNNNQTMLSMLRDGLDHNVEFWSGGLQMASGYCNIQRLIPLDDNDSEASFSRHLLYHTANNKQLQLQLADRLLRVDDFLGQIKTVQKVAQRQMEHICETNILLNHF